jgi:cell division protease FtsH
MVTEHGMSPKLGAVRYGTEHGDPFLGRTMGTQADFGHEVARDIDDEVRKLIEAAHTEAWEVLTEYRDTLDVLAGELLEKETLHRPDLERILKDVKKRPRLTMFDDFGGRIPSDKPPIKTPGEIAMERGEPWPPPVPEPAFKAAMAKANAAAEAAAAKNGNGVGGHANGTNGAPNGAQPAQPDYGAPAGWHAPGWPPRQPGGQPPHGYWYPPAPHQPQQPPQQPGYPPQQQYPPYPPAHGEPAPEERR